MDATAIKALHGSSQTARTQYPLDLPNYTEMCTKPSCLPPFQIRVVFINDSYKRQLNQLSFRSDAPWV